jgi:hypothetical protein
LDNVTAAAITMCKVAFTAELAPCEV